MATQTTTEAEQVEADLALAIEQGWPSCRPAAHVISYVEPTDGLLSGETYRIVQVATYAGGLRDIRVLWRTHYTAR